MPINPSIALQGRPVQPSDLLQQYGQVAQLQNIQQQRQAQALEIEQRQMQLNQMKALNDAYKSSIVQTPEGNFDIDTGRLTDALSKSGAGSAIPQVLEGVTKYKQAQAELQETNGKIREQNGNLAGSLGNTVKSSGYDPHLFLTLAQDAINNKVVSPQFAQPYIQAVMNALNQDPSGASAKPLVQKISDQLIAASPKQQEMGLRERETVASEQNAATTRERLDKESPLIEANSRKAQAEADLEQMKVRLGLMGNSEYDQFLARYAQNLGKTPATLTPEEGLASFQKFAEFKQDPEMRASAIAQRDLANTMRKIQLAQLPTQEDAKMLADDIQNHRLAPSQITEIRGRAGGQLGLMIERELKKTNPQFNWQEADAEFNLSKSEGFQNTVRYMDSVQNSIPQLQQAANALANGNVRSLNALVNAGKNQFNNIDLKKFQADRALVGDEIAKILQGGGTGSATSDTKLKQAQDLLGQSDSPQAIAATLGEVSKLIGFRRDSLTRGTYLEGRQPQSANTPAADSPKIGDIVTLRNGKQIKIKAIHGDGTFDGDEVK